ncbi:MAG: hypothetical protein V1660_02790 [archaeon]
MKAKLFAVFIAATILAAAMVAAGNGGGPPPQDPKTNTVHGFVFCKDPTGKGWHVPDANVQVDCIHSSTTTTVNTISNAVGEGGQYDADFLETVCATGDKVNVFAEKNGNTGNATGFMGQQNANIDVEITEISVDMGKCEAPDNNVPEFSSIAAGVALIGSAIGFAALRRRK